MSEGNVSSQAPKHSRTTSWSLRWRRVGEGWKEGGDAVGTGEFLSSWLGSYTRRKEQRAREESVSAKASFTLEEVATVYSAQLSKDGGLDISFSFPRSKSDRWKLEQTSRQVESQTSVQFPTPSLPIIDSENLAAVANQPVRCESPQLSNQLSLGSLDEPRQSGPFAATASVKSIFSSHSELSKIPKLNVVIMVVGTRGDVQPFIAFGNKLKEYGHRVRLASHRVYRDFVTTAGLEFYPLGGDPKVLIEYVVRNRGMIPGSFSDIKENRKQLKEIIFSTFDACTKADPEGYGSPFEADIIIANPPVYGHVHCAEKLGIPLHMMFTMPWTPTSYFSNPMARIGRGNIADQLNQITKHLFHPFGSFSDVHGLNSSSAKWANYLSYLVVEECIWIGIRDIINDFRKSLELQPVRSGSSLAKQMATLPWTYCWSQTLVSKPPDWLDNIDIVGFFFLNMSELSKYQPPPDLAKFLKQGPPPIYFGFGSLIISNPLKLTRKIFNAVKQTGVRAIISKGWAGLGEGVEVPPNIILIGNCPHDWLFPQCSAVVHHGGAGTTAAGLLAGCPTMVIPFFGDQPFWGQACRRAGVGPKPVLVDKLKTKKLVEAINFMSKPQVKRAAEEISIKMSREDGVSAAVDSFHKQLPIECIIKKDKELLLTWSQHLGDTQHQNSTGSFKQLICNDAANGAAQNDVAPQESKTSKLYYMTGMRKGFLKGFVELKRLIGKFQPRKEMWDWSRHSKEKNKKSHEIEEVGT